MPTANMRLESCPEIRYSTADPSEPCTVVIQLKHGRSAAALVIAQLTRLLEEQELGSVTKFAMGDHL